MYNVRIGSEGLVEGNLNSARPKALGCNLPAMDTENFHTFEPILVHFAPIRNKLCLNEGLLKTEREPHGITKMIDGRMRALDTAESNAITT